MKTSGEPRSILPDAAESEPLRVLLTNEARDRRDLVADAVARLGYALVDAQPTVDALADLAADGQPHVALVGVDGSQERALELIGAVVHRLAVPVIALAVEHDPAYVSAAARRGAFAYVVDLDGESLGSTIELALHRFQDYNALKSAFTRRAVIEQAKGILMAHQGLDQLEAFAVLREHARRHRKKVVEVAEAVVESHLLLRKGEPPTSPAPPPDGR